MILRWVHQKQLSSDALGETEYIESRFDYVPQKDQGYQNRGYFLLEHQGYELSEIKK